VQGVYQDWKKVPAFYDLSIGSVHEEVAFLVPADMALDKQLGFMGSMSCWDRTNNPLAEDAQCAYLQFWVELAKPQDAAAYRQFLVDYSLEQKRLGRYVREPGVQLRNLMGWLAFKRVVPQDVTLQAWMGLGFLLVCLVNTVGLMLAKCLRRSPEIGVRRALGASRRQIFQQFLVEAGLLGVVGGALGMALTALGLWGLSQGGFQHAGAIHVDGPMLGWTLVAAVLAATMAGVLPAWRACRIVPALQLKSQ
jgi:putative ABC transport system permease protein